jgi:hypothetical protein
VIGFRNLTPVENVQGMTYTVRSVGRPG